MHFSITSASLALFSLIRHISPAWQGFVFHYNRATCCLKLTMCLACVGVRGAAVYTLHPQSTIEKRR